MANIMNMKTIKNNPSRNGFDLSSKRNFTAKVGELLPVLCQEVIPGDKFSFDLKAMSRTQPLNTAAFARVREYYDFFYVPYSLLWNRANAVLSQMDYNQQHATALYGTNPVYSGELPYITVNQIDSYIQMMSKTGLASVTADNYFGYNRAKLSCKLLEYLGMGNYEDSIGATTTPIHPYNVDLNIFPLLAYQKIYSDFYRDEQWEKPDPSTFNVDYMTGLTGSSMNVNIPTTVNSQFHQNYNFFDLRYCNWPKDLYHGLIPSPQYGDTAVVPVDLSGALKVLDGFTVPVSSGTLGSSPVDDSGTTRYTLNSSVPFSNLKNVVRTVNNSMTLGDAGLSILALRQYEFLQKWKEIAGCGDQNYKDMTKRIWDVDVSDHLAERVRYLGGINTSIDINEVVNTNITGDFAADIAGKGVGITNGRVEFNSDGQYGFIMCIYHAMPQVDYTVDYINPSFMRVNAEDFANPVFDKVGMQAVNSASIYNTVPATGRPLPNPSKPFNVGYAPRYIDYKTGLDLSFGGFKRGDLKAWVIQYGYEQVMEALFASGSRVDNEVPQPVESDSPINYTFFKVNPNLLDSIMSVAADSDIATDQLLCSSFFDIKSVRNLDVDGLPY